MATVARSRGASGLACCRPHPREAHPRAGRTVGGNAAVLRSGGEAGAGAQHRTRPGSPSPRAAQHADVAVPSRRDSVAQELSRGDAAVACRFPLSEPRSLGVGRVIQKEILLAGEFRRRFPFDVALARYIDLLITPYREALRALHPFNAGSWDQGPSTVAVSRAG